MTTIKFKDLSLEDKGEFSESAADADSQKEDFGCIEDNDGECVLYKSKTDETIIYGYWQVDGWTACVSLYKII